MLELRRVRAGIFTEKGLVSLYDFEKAVDEYEKGNEKLLRDMIIPGEIVKEVYQEVQIKENIVDRILHGKPIHNVDLKKKVKVEKDKIVSVFSGERFVGMFKVINGKDIFAKSEFVLQPIKEK
jgi:tRNA U55 pseudouridine synthase TruB